MYHKGGWMRNKTRWCLTGQQSPPVADSFLLAHRHEEPRVGFCLLFYVAQVPQRWPLGSFRRHVQRVQILRCHPAVYSSRRRYLRHLAGFRALRHVTGRMREVVHEFGHFTHTFLCWSLKKYLPLYWCTKITLIYDTEKLSSDILIYTNLLLSISWFAPLEWANDYVILVLFCYEILVLFCYETSLKLLIPALKMCWLF